MSENLSVPLPSTVIAEIGVRRLIPPALVPVAIGLGLAIFGGATVIPEPYRYYAAALGSLALFLGGYGWKQPTWAAGRPLLPVALVPIALGASRLLEAGVFLPENLKPYAIAVGGLLALLAGRVLPEPTR